MENKILKTIRLFSMIEGNDRVLVGLSGGADSVCLLLLLTKLQPVLDILVEAVHVHHGIRGREADEDLLFAKQLCENLNVPFHERHVQVPDYAKNHHLSEEEAARVLRYQVFEDVADSIRANKIAVAHHREDNAETVLLNLCRGSGLTGLSGVPPKRDRIIRPLIEVSRQEIEDYLAEEGVLYRTDGTNLELAYTRNRLRHQVLPLLQNEVNTRAVQHIAEMAMEVREAEAYLTAQARESYDVQLPGIEQAELANRGIEKNTADSSKKSSERGIVSFRCRIKRYHTSPY